MADRRRYLLAYDIRHPRRLRRVHRVASDFGEALQYSVFVCDLTDVELVGLKQRLLEEIKATEDSVSIFDLGAATTRGVSCIELLGVRRDLPSGDAAIW
ncbi:MAG TPA: CRISPR-associated endonuclease Cas2 [Solirubrobacteraceae bacterium]|nr:CRISPR-associated endonuclease Cas2 [Solirubrobacteraceae bacterium]